ncbi:MAG: hypothetical protein R3B82_09630 [Sandaracinaceae bacterium]
MHSPSHAPPEQRIEAVREKYAARIKQRLSQPKIDVAAARDGILDCFVATYFGGLSQGISGYLGIDASEEQVAQVATAFFRKRLRDHGATFEVPTVSALDRVKEEVDKELHFDELPAELRGIHDQVCSVMLSKADGTLEHHGDRSAVRGTAAATGAAAATPPPAKPAAVPAPTLSATPSVSVGLRASLATWLRETADAAEGASVEELSERLAKAEKLVTVLGEFGG